jgi:hypothetical protein
MPLDATIGAFAEALLDPTWPPPAQAHGRDGRADARRFAVYRNNVAVALIGALESRFPVTRRLVGADFFRGAAGAFIAVEKPDSPSLIHYGVRFPDFLESFGPARDIAYLPDVARLEDAWIESYHSAEADLLALSDLAAVQPEHLGDVALDFHPAVRLLRLAHPAASIWAAHQGAGEPAAPLSWAAEDALITRPHAEVRVRILPALGYEFAAALMAGSSISEAAAPLLACGGDPGLHLVGLIESGAVSGFR